MGVMFYQLNHPPESLTLKPLSSNNDFNKSRLSPWISIVLSLIDPPHPQRFFSSPANLDNWLSSKSKPEITHTPLPLRPDVCLWIRIKPHL